MFILLILKLANTCTFLIFHWVKVHNRKHRLNHNPFSYYLIFVSSSNQLLKMNLNCECYYNLNYTKWFNIIIILYISSIPIKICIVLIDNLQIIIDYFNKFALNWQNLKFKVHDDLPFPTLIHRWWNLNISKPWQIFSSFGKQFITSLLNLEDYKKYFPLFWNYFMTTRYAIVQYHKV